MGISKGHSYRESNRTICDLCGRVFKTKAGCLGHKRFFHGLGEEKSPDLSTSTPAPIRPVVSPDLKSLTEDVARLKLLKEKRELTGLGVTQEPQPDLMEEAGLGKLEGTAKEILQKRALGLDTSPEPNQWWKGLVDRLSLSELVDLIRGVLIPPATAAPAAGSLGVIRELLSLLGQSDLRGLLGGSVATVPQDFMINGVTIPKGFPLSEPLLKLALQGKNGDPMANALLAMSEKYAPLVSEWIDHSRFQRGASPLSQQPKLVETCPKCDRPVDVSKVPPSGIIFCPNCQAELEVVSNEPTQITSKQQKHETTPCSGCGQLLNIDGYKVGDVVVCPVCETENSVISTTDAIRAEPPRKKEPWNDQNC
ncbi:hypothetical protein ACFLVH_05275 [Chloroflexota bacterium]